MLKRLKWPNWVNNNLIKKLLVGFIFFAPLFPKFPLKMINYTYIGIRFEDFYVLILYTLFIIQLLRKKITITNKGFLWLFLFFWFAVLLSYFHGAFVKQTILFREVGIFNALRRFEYMFIFFIAAAVVTTKRDFDEFLNLSIKALVIVFFYGLGQRFLHWPAMQTMNPEYSKGHILFLTPEARVSSTFAGHYDLAAYIVFFFPIVLALFFYSRSVFFIFVFLAGMIILVLTDSRTSFIAYFISLVGFLLALKKFRYLLALFILTVILGVSAKSLVARFLKTIQIRQIFVNKNTGQVVIPEKITVKELPAGTFYIEVTELRSIINNQQVRNYLDIRVASNEVETAKNEALVRQRILSDIRDEMKKKGKKLEATEEAAMVASVAAGLKPVYTVVSDISSSTRLQVEWPRAINAFKEDVILGTGPSSITEATDNDYLRWLGEFGLLGTIPFVAIIISIISTIILKLKQIEAGKKAIYIGFIFGVLALLINATYIDIFEASKIAFIFWMTAGFFIGSLNLYKPTPSSGVIT